MPEVRAFIDEVVRFREAVLVRHAATLAGVTADLERERLGLVLLYSSYS